MTLHVEDLRPPRPRNNTALPKEGGGGMGQLGTAI